MTKGGSKLSFLSVSSAYATLFAFSGLVIGFYVTIDIRNKLESNNGLSALSSAFIFLYITVVFVSAFHQLKIYLGFHQIETDEDQWKAKTGGWAGSSSERFYRFLILLVILGAFAKGGPVLDSVVLVSKIPCYGSICMGVPQWVQWLESANGPDNKSRIFFALISLTFFMFVVWELLAMRAIWNKVGYLNEDIKEIVPWIISDTLAFVIWGSIAAIFIFDASDVVFVIPVLFMLPYIGYIVFRYFPKRGRAYISKFWTQSSPRGKEATDTASEKNAEEQQSSGS